MPHQTVYMAIESTSGDLPVHCPLLCPYVIVNISLACLEILTAFIFKQG